MAPLCLTTFIKLLTGKTDAFLDRVATAGDDPFVM
jgi:hypothetical protein